MTGSFLVSIAVAAVCGVLSAALYMAWPRRMTAEEWVLHRRAVSGEFGSPVRSGVQLPGWLSQQIWIARLGESTAALERDLALLGLGTGRPTATVADVADRFTRYAVRGAVVGAVLGGVLWFAGGEAGLPLPAVPLAMVFSVGAAALSWRRLRGRATGTRGAIGRRLPRILTGTRMLLESGAATPERALAVAVAMYDDPAADLLREALRHKEVNRAPIETSLEVMADRYGVQELHRLADAFRVSGRYGTQLATTIAGFAQELRRASHADYRERMMRAPVLMTIPALIFFVVPLLVLVLFLVFAPLGNALTQL